MESVTLSRSIQAGREPIEQRMNDLGPFMEAAGFDTVTVDGDRMTIENDVGLLSISLTLRLLETDDVLAYEQVEGIFRSMETRYSIEEGEDETTVSAVTEFELDASLVGPILDSTVISRQRRKELSGQFDYLEATAGQGI